MKYTLLEILILILVLIGLGFLIHWLFFTPTQNIYAANTLVQTGFHGSVEKACVEGHQYYFWYDGYRGGMAPAFNDFGTPLHCEVESAKGETK